MNLCKNLVNGNQLAKRLIQQIKESIVLERSKHCQFQGNLPLTNPQLDIINVGFDDASLSYIKKKIDLASQIGIKFKLHQFVQKQYENTKFHHTFQQIASLADEKDINIYGYSGQEPLQSVSQIIQLIKQLNCRREVSGILVQLPLQPQLKQFTNNIIDNIDPTKDVDCLTLANRSRIIEHVTPQLLPCTPQGVVKIFEEYKIEVEGKKMVIAGRSALVGLPLFHLMLNRNATITLCHHHTNNLNELTKTADIVISAVGKPNLITQLKKDSIAIDIGITRDQSGKLCGDISSQAKKQCYLATPVPGGVGPLTVAMLMENTVKLWKKQMGLEQTNIQI